MRELGSELNKKCPECGVRIQSNSCRECGWELKADTTLRYRCAICDTLTRLVQLTPGEDGRDRCASCHFRHLKERVVDDPISPEDLERCKAQIAAALAKWLKPTLEHTAPPSFLERRGIHAMRHRAIVWCVGHPEEAHALGHWTIDIPKALP